MEKCLKSGWSLVNLKNFDLPNQLLAMEVAIITKPQNYGINQSQNNQLMLKICGFIQEEIN